MKKNRQKIYFLAVLFVFSFFAFSSYANAALVNCGTGSDDPCTICHLFSLIDTIITFLLFNILFPLAVVAFLVGGLFLLFGGGNQQRVTTGRTIITTAIIGILIAFAAWLIIDVIIGSIISEDMLFAPWNEFPRCN